MPTELPPRPFDSPRPISPSASIAMPGFLARVYAWMATGLLVTAGAALFTVSNETVLHAVFGNRLVFYGLLFAELGLVVWLSGIVGKLSSAAASAVFLLYSALNGVTLASIFFAFTAALDRLDVRRRGGHVRRDERLRPHHAPRRSTASARSPSWASSG